LGDDRLRQAGVDNVLLQEGNAADLPFLAQSFDVVLCRSALHHFRRPEATIQEMARVCRSGGRVVVSDMVAPTAEVRVAFDDLHRHLDPSHMGVFVSEEIVALLANEVGPIGFAELTGPLSIPLTRIISAVSDQAWVEAALVAEVHGGEQTGFNPEADSDSGQISVSFTSATVQAIRN
jgi:SAM-dependent methyltransferase